MFNLSLINRKVPFSTFMNKYTSEDRLKILKSDTQRQVLEKIENKKCRINKEKKKTYKMYVQKYINRINIKIEQREQKNEKYRLLKPLS